VIPPSVLEWAARVTGTERAERCTVSPLTGGAVSGAMERITVHMAATAAPARQVEVVRKRAFAHEVAGLDAVQSLRPTATAIPELIASGHDDEGPWLITPFIPGTPLAELTAPAPANLFASLARLHTRFDGAAQVPAEVPRVDAQWWSGLCNGWVLPEMDRHHGNHPVDTISRATALVGAVAGHPAVARTLDRLSPTLLHGDIHSGNVLVEDERAWLIDWGSCRVGPAMLDLANLVPLASPEFTGYRESCEELTQAPFDYEAAELGYRWAKLQIPIQYLPWMVGNRPTAEVEAALADAEEALAAL
jgi:aminoglycoside phosphotransferase (APT) family kinase protein